MIYLDRVAAVIDKEDDWILSISDHGRQILQKDNSIRPTESHAMSERNCYWDFMPSLIFRECYLFTSEEIYIGQVL